MFTGLVSDIGRVERVTPKGALRRLRIAAAYRPETIALGASIACNGPCLTVIDSGGRDEGSWFEVDVGAETLARTTAGAWGEGTRLNLERSLKIGDELGGHIVTGHVDGVAEILAVEPFDGMSRFSIRVPDSLARFVAEKGSVSLDGTSLTVNSVEGAVLSVLLIPHTLAVTTWGARRAGDRLNLEVDLMARYAARLSAFETRFAFRPLDRRAREDFCGTVDGRPDWPSRHSLKTRSGRSNGVPPSLTRPAASAADPTKTRRNYYVFVLLVIRLCIDE